MFITIIRDKKDGQGAQTRRRRERARGMLLVFCFSPESNEKINYEVFDVIDKKVIENESSSNHFTINVSNLNSGVYFIRLKTNNNIVTKRFIKE